MADAFEGWAIVELMGHRTLAGFVSEVEQFGEKHMRIDVPSEPRVTQFYGGKAIFSLTPTTEKIATEFARDGSRQLMPVYGWDAPQLSAPGDPADDTMPGESYADELDDEDGDIGF